MSTELEQGAELTGTVLQPLLTGEISLSPAELQQLSPAALAYLGDAVYELYIRSRCLLPPQRLRDYHQRVVAHVRAEAQAEYLRSLRPHLSNQELNLLRQGRNAASAGPKRVDPETYQQATSLETLLGYLYLTNPDRLNELLQSLDLTCPESKV
uniref:Mini-ribonuclease 3 n=1 Tax=Cyanothece sp. (strain PCC 7425 / ATCC 29141) TaxID=395961 RepID=B8HT79_CYAP4